MNFDFSDDAKTLSETARRMLTDHAGPDAARRIMESDALYDEALWRQVVDLGLTAARVPEAHGGVGLSPEESCILAEEFGRSLAPVPFLSTLLATEAILLGSEAQQARHLPGIADGSTIACYAWGEGANAPAAMPATRAEGGRLTGTKSPVADALAASLAVVTAAGDGGPSLWLVDLRNAGVTPAATLDLVRKHGTITLGDTPGEPLGTADDYQRFLDRAAVILAFEAIGTASAAMEMAVGYAKDRVAFGQRIGRYQGVKHKCADMYIKLELARAHALYGAWAFSADADELRHAAAAARAASLDAVRFAAEENVQLHGGIGFTWDSNCQFYYRRARQISAALGGRAFWADRLVRALEQRNRAA
ncbi:acyl-CoA dehydrogenase family protein [Sphingosinicella soli]|uniref:Alkylation response protein AidB-like acyl-CoA dehydrogenase n=1 Tax=Sphingosinicella soli TaxID=333708 RepID=A0A7W7B3V3_9SPHN|nr:acyl-CoA dehydrogenase family protein [Sphingosinicella soli]MBB4633519.1 alkylation response protein AidB-like acyl-CoA dehydrogenase [Sphingosinicella soli]